MCTHTHSDKRKIKIRCTKQAVLIKKKKNVEVKHL